MGMIARSFSRVLAVTVVVALPSFAAGKPTKNACTDAVHLTSDALLGLAVVQGKTIARDEGQCGDDFFPEGQKWTAIDRWGKAVGTVAAATSAKKGMYFRVLSGSAGARVYVRGRKAPFSSAEWIAPAGERERLIEAIGAKIPREVVFFKAGEKRFGVVTERSTFSVAELDDKGRWKRRYHTKLFAGHPVYAVRSIVDLNDDGMPEIVEHFSEYADGRGYEIVLGRKPNGEWTELADNQDSGP